MGAEKRFLAHPERFERPTLWFVAKYSIQLSYGCSKDADSMPIKRPCQVIFTEKRQKMYNARGKNGIQ